VARWLVDTNVLVRVAQPASGPFETARSAVEALKVEGSSLHIVPQNLVEFWAVATRPPENNGLGMTDAEAIRNVNWLESALDLLPEPPETFDQWKGIVVRHRVRGKSVYDARLVAAMIVNGVDHLLTLNAADFARYPEVRAVHPRDVI
jgi:predicted nucleic acid-binding protein